MGKKYRCEARLGTMCCT
ncbi:hypothetical protein E2C01_076696 [Portunus trituberculatus]|uniref:Uncharacterized protein n=1 Tax=Portunus trituberculatus TaxID=210409 RepID=A0A5B7I9D1_PORTR|nr:hypothetical protein [Portunus trituberculatus]